jgi:hypothetical protein
MHIIYPQILVNNQTKPLLNMNQARCRKSIINKIMVHTYIVKYSEYQN